MHPFPLKGNLVMNDFFVNMGYLVRSLVSSICP